jgi:hypothetical protein
MIMCLQKCIRLDKNQNYKKRKGLKILLNSDNCCKLKQEVLEQMKLPSKDQPKQ